jgi:hypothetical protein
MSPIIRLPPGPLHSTCNAKVAPSRFLLRIVHRPNAESMLPSVIFTRETPELKLSALHTLFSVYVPTSGKSSAARTGDANIPEGHNTQHSGCNWHLVSTAHLIALIVHGLSVRSPTPI